MSRFLQTFVWLLFVVACCAHGQLIDSQPTPVLPPAVNQNTPATIQPPAKQRTNERLPRIIYTPDENGKLIPWIDFLPWQRLDELMQLDNAANDEPQFVITELSLDARVANQHATIKNSIKIKTLDAAEHRIPIRMGACHFITQPKITSENDTATVIAKFDAEREEYELLIDGVAKQEVTVEFETRTALKKIGNRTLMRMALPRVPISSLLIDIPDEGVQSGIAEGMSARELESESGTRFEVTGLLPNLEFWWQPQKIDDVQTSFSAEGEVEVSIDDLGEVNRVATLRVSSFNKPMDGVTIRLPKATRWSKPTTTLSSIDYSVSPIDKSEDGREQLQIVFAEPSTTPPPVRIRVETDQVPNPSDAERQFDLAGFDVVGAATQVGEVRVFSEGAWLLNYQLGDFARRVSNSDPSAATTFEYSRPEQLSVMVTRQVSELSVEPLYVLDLDETIARLKVVFQCTRRGAGVASLKIDMGPWIYQTLGGDFSDLALDVDEQGRLEIPLENDSDRFEVTLTALLQIEKGLESVSGDDETEPFTDLEFDFPFPANANSLLQSTIAIVHEPNITTAMTDTFSYSEVTVPERLRTEVQDFNPVCVRMRTAGKPAKLAVSAAKLERQTTVDIETQIIDIDPNKVRVRQQMNWHVTNVPLSQALLTMTKDVMNHGRVEVEIDGTSVLFSRTSKYDFIETREDESRTYYTVQIPVKAEQGAFDMTVTYDWTNWSDDGEVLGLGPVGEFEVDLILPKRSSSGESISIGNAFRQPRVTGYDVSLTYSRNVALNGPWALRMDDADIVAYAENEERLLPLTTRMVTEYSRATKFEELVDRAWFQTWYTDSKRTDRAVFRVLGGDEDLQIELPDAATKNLTVWVDGEVTDHRQSGSDPRENLIEILVDANEPAHVVELQYSSESREPVGRLNTGLPRIAGAEILGQWYWHVVMPRNECMVTWPKNLTRAHSWDWSVLVPRRKSEMTLEELEDWSGARHTGGKVHAGSSEYLFGAMGEPEKRLSVRTAPLPIYVLAVAGGVFVVGLLLSYAKRKALVLAGVGVAICALIFLHPSYASVAGQIAAFGIVLVIMVHLLGWLLNHTPMIGQPSSSPSTWIRRLDKSKRQTLGETSSTLTQGSSRYRNLQ